MEHFTEDEVNVLYDVGFPELVVTCILKHRVLTKRYKDEFFPNRNIIEIYKDDCLYKRQRWYSNGKLEYEFNYKDGKTHGRQQCWYENGQVMYEENYKDRLLHGKQQRWYKKNGQAMYEKYYKDGKMHGKQQDWYRNGQLMYETYYINGGEICETNK